jgi:excisionase family DNA binding protein
MKEKAATTVVEAAPLWASYAEAERLFGLSRTTFWRLLRNGRIRTARVGRSVRLDVRSIEQFLEERSEDFA